MPSSVIGSRPVSPLIRAVYRSGYGSNLHTSDSVTHDRPSPPRSPAARSAWPWGCSWVHLRMCQSCGHIGCCDNSDGKHATAHHHETGHPIIRSAEPGEDWSWCYVDELMFRLEGG